MVVAEWALEVGLPAYLIPLPFPSALPFGIPYRQTYNGSTPLHLASCNGLLGCIKLLVQSGANVHARDATGFKPIDYCRLEPPYLCPVSL